MEKNDFSWDIGYIPFIYKPLLNPNNDLLPNTLPFTLGVDNQTGTLIQKNNKEVFNALQLSYELGSLITGVMDEDDLGSSYAEDFLEYLKSNLENIKGLKILEIGCGTGYLLSRLSELGANVTGIEPGPQGQIGAEKYGIPIIRDFFPSDKLGENYDLIIMYCVLEHISNPGEFLRQVNSLLTTNGKVAIAVPECESYFKNGDISIFFHEHWNYYTMETVINTFSNLINKNLEVVSSSFGGLIYGISENTNEKKKNNHSTKNDLSKIYIDYQNKSKIFIQNIRDFLLKDNVGVYVPGRIVNVLYLIKEEIDLKNIRFFDDNPFLYKTYFPELNIPIESRRELLLNSPDNILVMSNSFGEKIKSELRDDLHRKDVVIMTINELF